MSWEAPFMGDHSLATSLPRGSASATPHRPRDASDALTQLERLDAAIAGIEGEDRDLVRRLEEQRSEITLLTIRIRGEKARPLGAGLDTESLPQASRERERDVADLQSSLDSGLRSFEENLEKTHALRRALRRRRESAERERAAALEGLMGPTRAAYEYLVEIARTPVIVPVRQGRCSGCNADVSDGSGLVGAHVAGDSCPGCQRLLTVPV
jgi:predicted  nucleic acid-binding Zn-ribbon protein